VSEVVYKGIEYKVVQTANPTGWKWIVTLDEQHFRVGTGFSRASAITFAKKKIDQHLKSIGAIEERACSNLKVG
jgi:flavin-dependent dehydrogenase